MIFGFEQTDEHSPPSDNLSINDIKTQEKQGKIVVHLLNKKLISFLKNGNGKSTHFFGFQKKILTNKAFIETDL